MEIARKIASLLGEAFRQNALTATLGTAIAGGVFSLATLISSGAAAAGFINLSIFVVVPSVCVIAYAAALLDESILIRGGRTFILLLGLYFCLTLPAAPASEAHQWKLPATLAQVMAALFGGALIPAIFLRLAGWRLRRGTHRHEGGSPVEIRDQFGLLDLFTFITALSVLLTLAIATQRAYALPPGDFYLSGAYRDVVLGMLIAALYTGSAGLVVFCFWFSENVALRISRLIYFLALWILFLALPCAAALAFERASEASAFLIALALWVGVLSLPMTVASLICQARGWQLQRR